MMTVEKPGLADRPCGLSPLELFSVTALLKPQCLHMKNQPNIQEVHLGTARKCAWVYMDVLTIFIP